MFAAITPVLIFAAFILLLLVSLSAPIIKSIFLFRLTANVGSGLLNTDANGSVNFGVWGYCVSTINVSYVVLLSAHKSSTKLCIISLRVVGIDHSTAAQCSKAHLGYTFDKTVVNAL